MADHKEVKHKALEALAAVISAPDLAQDCPWKCKPNALVCLCRDTDITNTSRYRVRKSNGRAVIKNLETGNVRILPDRK